MEAPAFRSTQQLHERGRCQRGSLDAGKNRIELGIGRDDDVEKLLDRSRTGTGFGCDHNARARKFAERASCCSERSGLRRFRRGARVNDQTRPVAERRVAFEFVYGAEANDSLGKTETFGCGREAYDAASASRALTLRRKSLPVLRKLHRVGSRSIASTLRISMRSMNSPTVSTALRSTC